MNPLFVKQKTRTFCLKENELFAKTFEYGMSAPYKKKMIFISGAAYRRIFLLISMNII